jgi:hypothetical protein
LPETARVRLNRPPHVDRMYDDDGRRVEKTAV